MLFMCVCVVGFMFMCVDFGFVLLRLCCCGVSLFM